MPPITGNYSKGIYGGFDESRRFVLGLMRKGIPIVDADENQKEWIRFHMLRRAFDVLIGSASPNNGFRIVGDATANDFIIEGGDGTLDGAGRMYVAGLGCFLLSDIRYKNAGATVDQLSIHAPITFISGLGNTVLEDSSANFVPSALIGRTITPDVTLPGVTFTITANTARAITVSGDLTTAGILVGAHYRIELSTPVGARNDGVYLDTYVDEIDGTDEPDIRHDLGPLMAAQYYGQLQQRIVVVQGDTAGLPGSLDASYIDADGFKHFLVKLADIERTGGQAAINAPDVTDLRATSGSLTDFVRKIGDNMTGNLVMQAGADIVLAASGTVDGRDLSVDGAKLDLIDFTSQGIANKLKLISWAVQGTNLTGITTAQTNVSTYLKGKVPTTVETVKGIFSVAPYNRAFILRTGDSDMLIDADGDGVFGQITMVPLAANLSGTWTWTNAGFTINGAGGSALTQIGAGDIVQGPDNAWYTVATVPTNNQFTIVEPFGGATDSDPAPAIQRWLLNLVVNNEGAEVAATLPGPTDISWYYHAVFDEADRPIVNPMFGIPSDQVAAEVPDASTTVKGKVQLAAHGAVTAGLAVQASDPRLSGLTLAPEGGTTPGTAVGADDTRLQGIRVRKNSGVLSGRQRNLNLIEGLGVTITQVEDVGVDAEHDVTIAAPPVSSLIGYEQSATGNSRQVVVPANTLALDGQILDVWASGATPGSGGPRIRMGGTLVWSVAGAAGGFEGDARWVMAGKLLRVGAGTVIASIHFVIEGQDASAGSEREIFVLGHASVGITLSAANTIVVDHETPVGGNLVQFLRIRLER